MQCPAEGLWSWNGSLQWRHLFLCSKAPPCSDTFLKIKSKSNTARRGDAHQTSKEKIYFSNFWRKVFYLSTVRKALLTPAIWVCIIVNEIQQQRLSSTEGCLPPKVFCFNSIEFDLILSVAQLSSAIHYLFNFPAAADVLALSSSSTSMTSSASRIKVFKYRQTDRQMKPRIEVWYTTNLK